MKNDIYPSSGYQVKPLWLGIFFTALMLFSMPQVLAQTSFKILDQLGNPVMNAVISATGVVRKINSMAVMDQINKQFSPQVLVIQKNQSVGFPNSDDIRHHVYSFSAPKPFEIGLFKGQGSPPVQFDKAGVVVLGCNIHDQMIGYIYIAEDEITAVTDEDGQATLASSSEEYHIWHPRLSTSHADRIKYTFDGNTQNTQIVSLSLLLDKKKVVKRKFGGRKFGSGGQ
ncbi:MAG: plastocyanin [Paraglaciecola sp.]|jgi:plastocyanin